MIPLHAVSIFFFFNDTATTEIYTLSLHDALPISAVQLSRGKAEAQLLFEITLLLQDLGRFAARSEEHTSELQSRLHLVCRLLLEKKKKTTHLMAGNATVTTTIAAVVEHHCRRTLR